ncbi:MAG: branched-chain amino acid ABC transporter permease [Rhodobacteraceae bacterium]|nr:branched-chain amino acid ABC transporter permease [Paracoccaceae bacterium]
MASTTTKSAFWRGVRDASPFVLVVAPFAVLFGVVATEAGLNIAQTMGMTALVIAGAAQFTAVQLMTENAPVFLVIAAALAVNLRMAMYSAALAPYLGAAPFWQRALIGYVNFDQTYTASALEFERAPDMTIAERVVYFLGTVIPVAPPWLGFSLLGALFGSEIPASYALDFALPITFLAIVAPMLKSLAHIAAAATSVTFALLLAGLPSGIGLLIAGALAMAVGAFVETWQTRRRAR